MQQLLKGNLQLQPPLLLLLPLLHLLLLQQDHLLLHLLKGERRLSEVLGWWLLVFHL
jgi:hypothetical protein